MSLSYYLSFNGDCAEAFAYYQAHLGASDMQMMRYADGPIAAEIPATAQDKVMHGSVWIHGSEVMGSDAVSQPYAGNVGMRIVINVDDTGEAERLYAVLQKGGSIQMAMEETFWAQRFAVLTDQFGVPWMINCPKPEA